MIKTVNAEVDLSEVLNTQLFDFEKASESAGWIKELTHGGHEHHTPETEEYGISSFVYRRKLPFNADRFKEWFDHLPSIVRSKVLFGSHNTIVLHVYSRRQGLLVKFVQSHIGWRQCLN